MSANSVRQTALVICEFSMADSLDLVHPSTNMYWYTQWACVISSPHPCTCFKFDSATLNGLHKEYQRDWNKWTRVNSGEKYLKREKIPTKPLTMLSLRLSGKSPGGHSSSEWSVRMQRKTSSLELFWLLLSPLMLASTFSIYRSTMPSKETVPK